MPHVVVKMYPGRSEQQKAAIAAAVTRVLMIEGQCSEASVSVGIEDVEPERWVEAVYKPDIAGKADSLYKKPGYDPLAEPA